MKSNWDARIARATELISVYPFAAEALRFYAQVAMLQEKLYLEFQKTPARFFTADGSISGRLNVHALAPKFADFVRNIRRIAPPLLAEAADRLLAKNPAAWASLLETFWFSPTAVPENHEAGEHTPAELSMAWLFLQPAAEHLYARQIPAADESSITCPRCASKPIVGVLRPEGDGGKKSLICMLCAHEWRFRRIGCPACGETREPQMAFYSAPEIPHVRVDVCETCRTYLKTVDLTKTGLAVPLVDELAAMPLDLWANENGYHKLHMNVVGI